MHFLNDYKNAGGIVTTGSDSGFIYKLYGFDYIREFELLREAGFHPLEVIRSATYYGALQLHKPKGMENDLQFGILRPQATRADVQVALAHHDAAHRDQRRGGEADLFRAKNGAERDVPARLHAAVGLEYDTTAQVVHDQRLVGLGNTELPRQSSVFDAGQR